MNEPSTPDNPGNGRVGWWANLKSGTKALIAVLMLLFITGGGILAATQTAIGTMVKEFVIPTAADVEGTVTEAGANPAASVAVVVDDRYKDDTSQDGRFVIEDVPKGRHSISVYDEEVPLYDDGEFIVNQGDTRVKHDIELGESRPTALGTTGETEGTLPEQTNPAYEQEPNQPDYGLSLQESAQSIPPEYQPQYGGNPYLVTVQLVSTPELAPYIDRVTYYLHPTFRPSVVTRYYPEDNFALQFNAWGSFTLNAKVYLTNGEVVDLSTRVLDGS